MMRGNANNNETQSLGKFLIVVLISLIFCFDIPKTSAQSNETVLPIHCEWEKGNYNPTTTLVVVPLDSSMFPLPGASSTEIAKGIFYEFAYVRGNKTSPLNAVLVNSSLAYTTCNLPDYSANVVTGLSEGVFVIGVYGDFSKAKLQQIIDTKKITNILQSDLVLTDSEKNTVIALANTTKCAKLCEGLVPSKTGVSSRSYDIELGVPSYSSSVRQKEMLSFSLKIKNKGEFPIYPTGLSALQLVPIKDSAAALYHSSWVSPNIIAKLSGTLYPGTESIITATLGVPLLPGKHEETMQLRIAGKPISTPIKIAFVVEKDNLKLAKIVPKGGEPYANLRETPNMKGAVVGKIGAGVYVIVKDYQDAWVKIETKEGKVGWVYKPSVREI